MNKLSKALAIAISYLDNRNDNSTEDDDIQILESLAAELQAGSTEEIQAVKSALVSLGRSDLIEGLGLG